MKLKHKQASKYLNQKIFKRLFIVSGGQSGVDRAAFDVALKLKLPMFGWCPKGRLAEDGRIKNIYPLQETISIDTALRTELNAYDSDATLILSFGKPRDGTRLTIASAKTFKKPYLEFDISRSVNKVDIDKFRDWINKNSIKILNIAGPRESFSPGKVYSAAYKWIIAFLASSLD